MRFFSIFLKTLGVITLLIALITISTGMRLQSLRGQDFIIGLGVAAFIALVISLFNRKQEKIDELERYKRQNDKLRQDIFDLNQRLKDLEA